MQAVLLSDEEIKRQKKDMGSRNHSLIQLSLITQMVLNYNKTYKAVPELSLDLNGVEKVPDLCIYRDGDIKLSRKDVIRMKELPLGVIEILSPRQALAELVDKSDIYFDAGISSYWLVTPQVETIHVYSAKGKHKTFTIEDILKDTVLDIELDLSKIF